MTSIDLSTKNPQQILEILGNIFEESRERGDIESIQEGIKLANEVVIEQFDSFSKAIYYYFIGNAWSYIQSLRYSVEDFPLECEELEQQIKHYRRAYSLIKATNDNFNKCQILTNMGNLFSHIGRFSEAQDYFNLCLNINNKFGMGIGNKGFALYYYARVVFDPVQQFIFLQYAYKYLTEALKLNDVYIDAKHGFYQTAKQIEVMYPADKLNELKSYDNYYKGLKKEEVNYRKWSAANRLFINPLNDILTDSVVSNDYFFTPTMILKFDEKPIYQTIFNQLKQEFASARYLYYEASYYPLSHYSDKEVVLMDTLDYASYSFTLEKVKICFRMCFSLFDKIAYLINLYLKLGHHPDKVSFRNIWYINRDKNKGLLDEIKQSNNWSLRGLFWLSKDFDEKGFETSIEPEAKEIATIRNYLEHKSFKIVESSNPDWTEKAETYEIERSLFYEKTLKLLKLSRSAIMYTSFLIYDEEGKRAESNRDKIALPVDFNQINDIEKL